MGIRDDLAAALQGAQRTVERTRLMARHISAQQLRDALLLDAVALESVIKRVEAKLEAADPGDLAELIDEIERVAAVMERPADLIH